MVLSPWLYSKQAYAATSSLPSQQTQTASRDGLGPKSATSATLIFGKATVRIFYQDWVYFENSNFNITKMKIALKWMINHTASRNQNLYKLNIFLKVVCYLSTLRCSRSNNSIYQICRSVSKEHRIDAPFLISPSHCQTNLYSLSFHKEKSREINDTSLK